MRRSLALALVLGSIAVPALADQPAAPAKPAVVRPVGDAERGEALAKRWCSGCHAAGPAATAASDAAPTFVSIAKANQKDPDRFRAFLEKPHQPMPPLQLSRAEIEDIVAYFRSLAAQ